MPLVTRWTGRETKALREALRMTTAELGDKLGVSDRIVARWEAQSARRPASGPSTRPRSTRCWPCRTETCTAGSPDS